MKRPIALLFAVGGVVLLSCISYFISAGSPWLALLFAVAAVIFIGFGFIVKARQRKRD